MSDLVGQTIYILDYADYDNRGGMGKPYATLERAQAACPSIREWTHHPSVTYDWGSTDEEWGAVCPNERGWSAGSSIPVIVAQVIR